MSSGVFPLSAPHSPPQSITLAQDICCSWNWWSWRLFPTWAILWFCDSHRALPTSYATHPFLSLSYQLPYDYFLLQVEPLSAILARYIFYLFPRAFGRISMLLVECQAALFFFFFFLTENVATKRFGPLLFVLVVILFWGFLVLFFIICLFVCLFVFVYQNLPLAFILCSKHMLQGYALDHPDGHKFWWPFFQLNVTLQHIDYMWLSHLIVAKRYVFPVAITYSLCVVVYCADEPTKPVERNLWIFYIRVIFFLLF